MEEQENRMRMAVCSKCGKLTLQQLELEKKTTECDGYFDDENGDLQMKLKVIVETVTSCVSCLNYFIARGYELIEN